jgi:hypothetical protein
MVMVQDTTSSLQYAVYTNGQLASTEPGSYGCASVGPFTLGGCPTGGSGQIVVTCNDLFFNYCPLYYW